jgi:hypothetical protein
MRRVTFQRAGRFARLSRVAPTVALSVPGLASLVIGAVGAIGAIGMIGMTGCGVDSSGLYADASNQKLGHDGATGGAGVTPTDGALADLASNGGAAGQPAGLAGSGGGGGATDSPAGDAGTGGAASGSGGTGGVATGGAGAAGTNGAAGVSGTAGDSGAAGTGGAAGAGGTAGDSGAAGTGGAAGVSGTAGTGEITGGGGAAGAGAPGGAGEAGRGGAGAGTAGGAGGPGGSGGEPGGSGGGGARGGGCTPSNCADGCCAGNQCVHPTSAQQCGARGAACASCAPCELCSTAGQCAIDPASPWTIVADSAQLARNPPGGGNWDPDGGDEGGSAPDPFCEYENPAGDISDQTAGVTSTVTDELSATWDQVITPTGVTVRASTLMANNPAWRIWVGDEDCRIPNVQSSCGTLGQIACSYQQPIPASALQSGTLVISNFQSCVSLTLSFECQAPAAAAPAP